MDDGWNEEFSNAVRREVPRWITIFLVATFVLFGYKACIDHVAHKEVEEQLFNVNKQFIELLQARQSREVMQLAKKLVAQKEAREAAATEEKAEVEDEEKK